MMSQVNCGRHNAKSEKPSLATMVKWAIDLKFKGNLQNFSNIFIYIWLGMQFSI